MTNGTWKRVATLLFAGVMLFSLAAGTSAATTSGKDYTSPVDFATLQKVNPDIYAWIDIPDTDISYPVLNRPDSNEFYLKHNSLGKSDKKGALFTEDYNSRDFDDPVTIIYGHNTINGSLFGTLEKDYSDQKFFQKHQKIVIYLPDREYEYKIFAAVPYSNVHLLYYYNFSRPRVFNAFFKDIMSVRSLGANFDKTVEYDSDDDILILSTCLNGNSNKRYLVLAVKTAAK